MAKRILPTEEEFTKFREQLKRDTPKIPDEIGMWSKKRLRLPIEIVEYFNDLMRLVKPNSFDGLMCLITDELLHGLKYVEFYEPIESRDERKSLTVEIQKSSVIPIPEKLGIEWDDFGEYLKVIYQNREKILIENLIKWKSNSR